MIIREIDLQRPSWARLISKALGIHLIFGFTLLLTFTKEDVDLRRPRRLTRPDDWIKRLSL